MVGLCRHGLRTNEGLEARNNDVPDGRSLLDQMSTDRAPIGREKGQLPRYIKRVKGRGCLGVGKV